MSNHYLALAFLFLASAPFAPQDARPTPMSPPGRVVLPEGGLTVPLLPGRRLPMVEVHIGEAGPFRFVVEWAGNVFAVSEKVRDEAGLETIGRSQRGTDFVVVPGFELGEAIFEDLIADVPPFFTRTDHDGALGLNVFRELVATLDFPRGELRLTKTALPDPTVDRSIVAYSPGPGGSPRIPIELGGHAFQAVLDTAAERALIMDDSFLDALTISGELRAGPMIMTPGMGRLQTREGRIAGELVVGSVRSMNPLALIHKMREPEILLGGGFLRGYVISLDQANRRLQLIEGKKDALK